ncbi:MAG: serine/threonine-protein kinase, partial [Anaerolineae bacterium]|nr:serine/threonine-protein kinase [Anaerolineae bacterium]
MLAVGELVNQRFRIMRQIAEGGQSYVYLASDERTFNRPVVVKEYKPPTHSRMDAAAGAEQFEAMARLLAQLNHPNIVQVIDFCFHNGTPILVTEYIEGETLEAKMRLLPMGFPEEEVLRIADQLCDALSYLHSHTPPIIYRDLTPSNVILTPSGAVKLIDFSIARTYKEGQSVDTEAFGTAGYAPPEQHGRGQTGPYSDVYALGATLLRLVTGFDPSTSPFVLPRADKVHGDLKAVSPALTEAIAKATQIDPKRRFQSIEEMRRALRHDPFPRRVQRAIAGGWGVALGLGGLVLLVLCGGVGAMVVSQTPLPVLIRLLQAPNQPAATSGAFAAAQVNTITPSPLATQTLTPTAASLPTAASTSTPQPPTPTPPPTQTPAPAPLPTATPTALPTQTPAPTP